MNVSKINDSMKEFVKKHGSTRLIASLKSIMLFLKKIQQFVWTVWSKIIKNHINLWVNANKPKRYLEIGSGNNRLPGFETLDIFGGRYVDYVYNAARPLPFKDNTFDLIYASHVLEHIPWYMTEQVLREWFRILKPTGQLEVWVPDGLKICKVLVDVELGGEDQTYKDGWYKFNPERDPCVWVSGRLYAYGYGTGKGNHPNWHRALFTSSYLLALFTKIGFVEVRQMDRSEVRGYDHGWINLGIRGQKP